MKKFRFSILSLWLTNFPILHELRLRFINYASRIMQFVMRKNIQDEQTNLVLLPDQFFETVNVAFHDVEGLFHSFRGGQIHACFFQHIQRVDR